VGMVRFLYALVAPRQYERSAGVSCKGIDGEHNIDGGNVTGQNRGKVLVERILKNVRRGEGRDGRKDKAILQM
ncbi:hypothetical protein OVV29_32270, partial [Klebsiella pneumoniae]|nr:hypothetical protein [Klebsiella pneumoniae]